MEKEKQKELQHFSHDHPLMLKKLPKQRKDVDDDDDSGDGDHDDGANYNPGLGDHICYGCRERISLYGEPYCYRCDECDYDLHKVCAEAPLTIHHPLHQEHPLNLRENPHYGGYTCIVNCCKRVWRNFTYSCFQCDFNFDIICATAGERKVYNPHHNHLLTLIGKTISAECNACGIEEKGAFYLCTTCVQFWLHKDCALLPKEISIQQTTGNLHHHDHPLVLAYGLVQRYAQHSRHCRICELEVDKYLWLYSCEKCRYFVHLNCAMTPSLGADVKLSDTFLRRLFEEEHIDPNVLNLPLEDECHSLMEQLFLKGSLNFGGNVNEDSTVQAVINHSVHHHPLVLFDDEAEWAAATSTSRKSILHNPMKKVKLLCNGCVTPIAQTPFYRCERDECSSFFVHKWCAELPGELLHRVFHDRCKSLTLLPKAPTFFGIFRCEICGFNSNGFAYGCVECKYYIDVRCAFMPVSIKHEAHPEHVLRLRKKKIIGAQSISSSNKCRGCWTYSFIYEGLFYCDQCEFKLCTSCAQLPKTMRHKYDKHPLKLMYHPPEDHISQYFCDICENTCEMDPNFWFYHCSDCDQSMHVYCIGPGIGIKYGGFLTIESHPHPLNHAEWWYESDVRCNDCSDKISYGFRCFRCNYALDYYCASKHM